MRMVSNRHLTGQSMKKFKKIHVQHKVYMLKPTEKAVIDLNVNESVAKAIEESVAETTTVKDEETEVTVAKPKPRSRKKKTTEIVENNEEKPEDNG